MKVVFLILSSLIVYSYQGTCENKLPHYDSNTEQAKSGVASCSSLTAGQNSKGYSQLCCYLSFEYEQVEDDDNPLEYNGCITISSDYYLNYDGIENLINTIESGTLGTKTVTQSTSFPNMCNWEDRCSEVEIDCSSNYLKLSVLFLIAFLL